MIYETWAMDVTNDDMPRAFCPLDEEGNVVVGLTFVTDTPPGRVVGVFSEDGQDAVEAWCAANPDVLAEFGLGGERSA